VLGKGVLWMDERLKQRLDKALQMSYEVPAVKSKLENFPNTGELIQLTEQIQKKGEMLNSVFWTKEDIESLHGVKESYEVRIQNMIRATLANLDWYQKEGWKKFTDERE
jgi:hypothetical protein